MTPYTFRRWVMGRALPPTTLIRILPIRSPLEVPPRRYPVPTCLVVTWHSLLGWHLLTRAFTLTILQWCPLLYPLTYRPPLPPQVPLFVPSPQARVRRRPRSLLDIRLLYRASRSGGPVQFPPLTRLAYNLIREAPGHRIAPLGVPLPRRSRRDRRPCRRANCRTNGQLTADKPTTKLQTQGHKLHTPLRRPCNNRKRRTQLNIPHTRGRRRIRLALMVAIQIGHVRILLRVTWRRNGSCRKNGTEIR